MKMEIDEIMEKHIQFAEKTIKAQGDLKPMVIGFQNGVITPIIVAGREEIRAMIDLFGEDADWVCVLMTAWMRIGVTAEYLRDYETGQIETEPEREEVLMIQIALRDGSNKTTVKRIIRDDEIRFEEVHLPRGVSFDGYLSL
jgi:hypothetical protein